MAVPEILLNKENFPDDNLRKSLCEELDKEENSNIYYTIQDTISLDLGFREIKNIKGLEYFIYLKRLYMRDNEIEDISVLSNLEYLECLHINGNKIKDISVLEELTNIDELNMSDNEIKYISSLYALKGLRFLDASNNNIEDISVLEKLTNLESIDLSDNNIIDISVLLELASKFLDDLTLHGNKIKDRAMLEEIYSHLPFNDKRLERALESIKLD